MTTFLSYTAFALAVIAVRYLVKIFDLVQILKGRKRAV